MKTIDDIDLSIILNPNFDKWYSIVKDILFSEEFQKRKLFLHHHQITVWQHSINVSFKSFLLAKKIHADETICAIAGLLHDFYPWSWIYNKELEELDEGKYLKYLKDKHQLFKKHGFIHAKAAAFNYQKYFPTLTNKKITNSIECHMFPLNLKPPRYKEGYLITIIDKISAIKELLLK